jgi:hypothetical protein
LARYEIECPAWLVAIDRLPRRQDLGLIASGSALAVNCTANDWIYGRQQL